MGNLLVARRFPYFLNQANPEILALTKH